MDRIDDLDEQIDQEQIADGLLEPISLLLAVDSLRGSGINGGTDDTSESADASGGDRDMSETDPLIIHDVDATPQRTIGVGQLFLVTYMISCGGPFGAEDAVGAGGPVYVMAGLALIVLLWCIPQALMSAELSLLCGANGGSIVWIDRAFGGTISFFNVANVLFSNVTSITVSVVLFVRYLPPAAQTFWPTFAIRFVLLIVAIVTNFMGPKVVSFVSLALLAFMFIPFVCILIVLATDGKLASIDFGAVIGDIPAFSEVNWPVLLSTLVWLLGSFDSVGALAGEVKGGKKEFLTGVMATLPVSYANYIGPMLICLIAVPNWRLWTGKDASFNLIATGIAPWLGNLMTVASLLAMFGQGVAGIAFVARQFWSCGVLGLLPEPFSWSRMSRSGLIHIPFVATITVAVLMFGFSFLPFTQLA